MSEAGFIDAAPSGWKEKISLSEVYREGSALEKSLLFPIGGKIRHWGQVFSFAEPIAVEAAAAPAGEYVAVDIFVSARGETVCSKCLEPAGVAINGKLRYLFTSRPYSDCNETAEEQRGAGEEEIITLSSWDETVGLGDLVWETLITALPSVVLCSAGCKGLCPLCGADLNKRRCDCGKKGGDPRFEALKGLLED